MTDVILTGASRGIGAALAVALAEARPARVRPRLVLTARDEAALHSVASQVEERGANATCVVGDLGDVDRARELGQRLSTTVEEGATLIHNAGIWPAHRELTTEGLERAFVVNCAAPLAMQSALLHRGKLARVMAISAGLIIKGRIDADRTPTGEDFSSFRTYCSTKLCFALAMRDVAKEHPNLDVVVLHPGVVRTSLGARGGPIGWLLALVKRGWEAPETCGQRLATLFERERWSEPGEAAWLVETERTPWPDVANDAQTLQAVLKITARFRAES